MHRILLIDDDAQLGPPLALYFERFELELVHALKPSEGLAQLASGGFDAAILFADIRGYTAFSERHDPETVVEVLNSYLQHQADLVTAHNGDIDKFVGDQIMAVFGGPGTVLGPIVGALSLSAISEVLSSEVTSIAGLFFGVVVVAAVVLMPRGLADIIRQFRKTGWRYFSENIRATRL